MNVLETVLSYLKGAQAQYFKLFLSGIPADVIKAKSYLYSFLDPTCASVRISGTPEIRPWRVDVSFESPEQGQAKCKLTCKFAYCKRSLKAQKDFRGINMGGKRKSKEKRARPSSSTSDEHEECSCHYEKILELYNSLEQKDAEKSVAITGLQAFLAAAKDEIKTFNDKNVALETSLQFTQAEHDEVKERVATCENEQKDKKAS